MPRYFAVIPAAGRSRRMGRGKLMLPWGEGVLVDGVVRAYRVARVEKIVAAVHCDDTELAAHLRAGGVDVVVPPSPPPEMKDSVRIALEQIERKYQPAPDDAWLLAPADVPGLSAEVTRRVMEAATHHPSAIIIPAHQGKNGHPALFPWPLAAEVGRLTAGEGVNALLHRHVVALVECGPAALAEDVDTPEDYERASGY